MHAFQNFFRSSDAGGRELSLAQTFEVSEDRQTLVFTMVPGVKFWDDVIGDHR